MRLWMIWWRCGAIPNRSILHLHVKEVIKRFEFNIAFHLYILFSCLMHLIRTEGRKSFAISSLGLGIDVIVDAGALTRDTAALSGWENLNQLNMIAQRIADRHIQIDVLFWPMNDNRTSRADFIRLPIQLISYINRMQYDVKPNKCI